MKKEYIKLDSPLVELELMQERAKIVCGDLVDGYFGSLDSKYLDYCRGEAKIRNDIVFEYLCQMREKIQELRSLISEGEENNNERL